MLADLVWLKLKDRLNTNMCIETFLPLEFKTNIFYWAEVTMKQDRQHLVVLQFLKKQKNKWINKKEKKKKLSIICWAILQ